MGRPDSERISMIRSAVLIQYKCVTDGLTELQWHLYTRQHTEHILPRVKRKEKENLKSRMQKKSSLKLYKNYTTNIKE